MPKTKMIVMELPEGAGLGDKLKELETLIRSVHIYLDYMQERIGELMQASSVRPTKRKIQDARPERRGMLDL